MVFSSSILLLIRVTAVIVAQLLVDRCAGGRWVDRYPAVKILRIILITIVAAAVLMVYYCCIVYYYMYDEWGASDEKTHE